MKSLFTALCLLLVTTVSAQSLEERFRAFQQSAEMNYTSFRDAANQHYADFMREAWEPYDCAPAVPAPEEEPVPPVIYEEPAPELKPAPAPIPGMEPAPIPLVQIEQEEREIVIKELVTPPAPQPQPEPIDYPEPEPQTEENACVFEYFGTICTVRVPLQLLRLAGATNEHFADGWVSLSNGDYDATLADCLQLREALSLCDWAYLQMLYELSKNAYLANNNESVLLCAWLYCQSGYQMRLALDGGKLNLLYASQHTIYQKSYFTLDGQRYYPLKSFSKRLEICTVAFEKEQALSLYMLDNPHLASDYSAPRLLQSKKYSALQVSVQTNQNLLSFYETYPSNELNSNPLTRWAMYANTPLTKDVRQMIYPALYEHLQGETHRAAAEKLLNFVQTAFDYEYDDKVWGGDRAFFAEETLFYPYADCEDRSVLFSRFVRDLLGLPVVLIYYPGHLATAVAFPEDQQEGDYIMLDGIRFTICDPTYIGAPVGDTMPGMKNETAQVMLLE